MKRAFVTSGLLGLLLLCGCGKGNDSSGGSGWSGFDPDNGKFTVNMPGTPTEQPMTSGKGKSWTSTADGLTYSVSYQELDVPAGTADSDRAESLMNDEVEHIDFLGKGKVLGEHKPLMIGGAGGVPGREVDVEIDKNNTRRIRMCLVGNRLYEVEISGPREKVAASDADSFLDSFRLGK